MSWHGNDFGVVILFEILRIFPNVDADVSFPSNIYISSKHCRILRDRDGIVWLEDVR